MTGVEASENTYIDLFVSPTSSPSCTHPLPGTRWQVIALSATRSTTHHRHQQVGVDRPKGLVVVVSWIGVNSRVAERRHLVALFEGVAGVEGNGEGRGGVWRGGADGDIDVVVKITEEGDVWELMVGIGDDVAGIWG